LQGPVLEVDMVHNAAGVLPATDAWLNDPKFHELTHVAVGARVVYKSTVNKATGATNSKMGTVNAIKMVGTSASEVHSLSVLLDGPEGRSVTVTRSMVSTTHRNGRAITKKTFPIVLGYAITAHRAQGATLSGTVIMDVRGAFTPGIAYVMLSRVTNRRNLRILGGLKPADFTPVNDAAFELQAGDTDGSSSGSGSDGSGS
jgi:hypothetical protein